MVRTLWAISNENVLLAIEFISGSKVPLHIARRLSLHSKQNTLVSHKKNNRDIIAPPNRKGDFIHTYSSNALILISIRIFTMRKRS